MPAKAAKSDARKGKGASRTKNALQRPVQLSKELQAIVGKAAMPRTEVISKVWTYIKAQELQNPENRREIKADDKLRPIFGRDTVTMFEMNSHLSRHMK
jgi:chromatin remodeling complex protein RSC6